MGGFFSPPSPPPPPPPPPLPTTSDKEAEDARARERRRATAANGQAKTMVTGGLGDTSATPTEKKTLLGGG